MKFYAVKIGKCPGIYESWEECEAQVKGFPNASYKSFRTRQEAQSFLTDLSGDDNKPEPSCADDPAWPEIYVDGSYLAATGEYSYGMVILFEGEELTFCGKGDDPDLAGMRNVAGEILGARKAMEYALKEGWEGIYLYHDYAGIACWCTEEWKAGKPGTVAYRDFYRGIRDRLKVVFKKVKGHSHNRCNDLADALAKKALGIE